MEREDLQQRVSMETHVEMEGDNDKPEVSSGLA